MRPSNRPPTGTVILMSATPAEATSAPGRSAALDRPQAPAHVALVGATLIFGLNYPIAKIALVEVPPVLLAATRVVVSALLLLVAWRARRAPSGLTRSDLPRLALFALLGVLINQGFFITGLHLSTPINASVLMTTIPVTTVAFALLLGRERASRRKIAGTAIAFTGALYLVGVFRFDLSEETMLGNLLVFTNACSYGLFLVLSREMLRRCSPVAFMAVLFSISTVVAIPAGWLSFGSFDVTAVSARAWLAVAYVATLATAGAHLLNSWSLQRVDSSTVGIYVFLQPVIATASSLLLLGDRLRSAQVIAAVLVFTGVYLAAIRRRRTAGA